MFIFFCPQQSITPYFFLNKISQMPQEKREIIFSEAEVQSAIVNYCMRSNISLPKTRFAEMKVASGNGEVTSLTLTYTPIEGSSANQDVTFVTAKIAVALLMFCSSLRIPIPKKSNKSLSLNKEGSGKGITLHIHVDTKA